MRIAMLAFLVGLIVTFVGPTLPIALGLANERNVPIRYCARSKVQSLSVSRAFMQITDHGLVLCKDGTTESYVGSTASDITFKVRYRAWETAFGVLPLLGVVLIVCGFGYALYAARHGLAFA